MTALQIASALTLILLVMAVVYRRVSDRLGELERECAERKAGMDAWMRPRFTPETDSAGDHLWGDSP